MSNVVLIANQIRAKAREIGYTARMSGAFILNPHLPDQPFYEHWSDGYDLGVRDANEELLGNSGEPFLAEDFA
jgi:hypothetical protein